jgi:DNA (cytosine-5)-methyltransferase 1
MHELALFAGAGGGILGGLLLGWRTVCAVELDPYARSVLLARQNDGTLAPFPVWDDIRTFDGRPWRGRVDVVSGGFPCTDISSAGKGAGIAGEHSGLWVEMARVVCEVRPRFVFVENSPMLASRGLGRVLGDLAALGFDARWGVFSACLVGAPHTRERMWVAAHAQWDQQSRQEPCRREAGRVGREQQYAPWNQHWFRVLSRLRGMGDGVAHRVDRTDAIRNGQVPLVAATAWRALQP